MVMDREPNHEAIGLLVSMCNEGCNEALRVSENASKKASVEDEPKEIPVASANSDSNDASAAASSASKAELAADDGDEVDEREREDILQGGRLAAQALERIAEDDWCREALVQANVLPGMVRMLQSPDPELQQYSAAAIAWLSACPPEKHELDVEHNKHNKMRTSYIKRFAHDHPTDDQWKPLGAYACGWIGSNILACRALKPLMHLISPGSGSDGFVQMHVAKVFANLASSTTRKQIIKAGAISVLVKALNNQLSDNLRNVSSDMDIMATFKLTSVPVSEDLLKALTQISLAGKTAKLTLAAEGFLVPLVGLLSIETPLRRPALEALRGMSECSENVGTILEIPHALDYVTALSKSSFRDIELQLQVSVVWLLYMC